MCSTAILNAASCYLDNWVNITTVLGMATIMGLLVATMVGMVLMFIKKG